MADESTTTPKIISRVDSLLPVDEVKYFKQIEANHFGSQTTGSRFIEVSSLERLLELTSAQRGGLGGDDRDKFQQLGVPPSALVEDCRYLMVETPGRIGIQKATDLAEDMPVKVVRTKPGVPCSLVVEVEPNNLPLTKYGTVIIGPKNDADPTEMIWTAHPGPPIKPAIADIWPEGTTITATNVVAELGDNVYVKLQEKVLV